MEMTIMDQVKSFNGKLKRFSTAGDYPTKIKSEDIGLPAVEVEIIFGIRQGISPAKRGLLKESKPWGDTPHEVAKKVYGALKNVGDSIEVFVRDEDIKSFRSSLGYFNKKSVVEEKFYETRRSGRNLIRIWLYGKA